MQQTCNKLQIVNCFWSTNTACVWSFYFAQLQFIHHYASWSCSNMFIFNFISSLFAALRIVTGWGLVIIPAITKPSNTTATVGSVHTYSGTVNETLPNQPTTITTTSLPVVGTLLCMLSEQKRQQCAGWGGIHLERIEWRGYGSRGWWCCSRKGGTALLPQGTVDCVTFSCWVLILWFPV